MSNNKALFDICIPEFAVILSWNLKGRILNQYFIGLSDKSTLTCVAKKNLIFKNMCLIPVFLCADNYCTTLTSTVK